MTSSVARKQYALPPMPTGLSFAQLPASCHGYAMFVSSTREKLINAIVFFAANTRHCGKVKLFKLLYLLDFAHFRETGRSVTGLGTRAAATTRVFPIRWPSTTTIPIETRFSPQHANTKAW